MITLQSVIGAMIAVIVAGMPAVIALLKIRQLHVLINSRLTQLIEATSVASHSVGMMEGRAEGRRMVHEETDVLINQAVGHAKELIAEAAATAREVLHTADLQAQKDQPRP